MYFSRKHVESQNQSNLLISLVLHVLNSIILIELRSRYNLILLITYLGKSIIHAGKSFVKFTGSSLPDFTT